MGHPAVMSTALVAPYEAQLVSTTLPRTPPSSRRKPRAELALRPRICRRPETAMSKEPTAPDQVLCAGDGLRPQGFSDTMSQHFWDT